MQPDYTELPQDWEAQVTRAYTVFGIDPLDGMDELAFGDWFDPDFLRAKAQKQLRDIKGKFRKMRAKIFGDTAAERRAREERRKSAAWAQPRRPPLPELPVEQKIEIPEPAPPPPRLPRPRPEPLQQFTAMGDALWGDQQLLDINPEGPSPADLPRGSEFDALGYRPGHLLQHPRQSARALASKIADDVQKQYEEYIKQTGDSISEQEYVQIAAEAIRSRILNAGPIQMRRKINRLGKMGEGSKNQFETKTSSGALAPDARRAHEQVALMVDVDQPDHLRPSYGYFGDAVATDITVEGLGTEQYGAVVLTMKPSIESRVTATPGDSLDIGAANAPTLADLRDGTASPGDIIASAGPTFIRKQMNDVVRERRMTENAHMRWGSVHMPSPYIEAQMHGGVPLSDVQTITLDGRALSLGLSPNESQALFQDLSSIQHDPMNPVAPPDLQKSFDIALDSVALSMDDFGEPGSPLRDAAEQAKADIFAMYQRGEIDSVGQAPQFKALLQQYFQGQGFDLTVEVNADPPKSGDRATAHLAERERILAERRESKIQEDILNYEWYINNNRNVPERLLYISTILAEREAAGRKRRAESPPPFYGI